MSGGSGQYAAGQSQMVGAGRAGAVGGLMPNAAGAVGYGGVVKNGELLRRITELKKKETQVEAARKLHQYLAQYQEDCDDSLFNQFRSMLQSSNLDYKFGAILAINKVVRIGRETRIVHNVKKIMQSVLDQLHLGNKELVEKAAQCLGILAEAGGKNTAEAIDQGPMMAIQFLKEDRDPKSNNMKKYSAVLVLKEFCKKHSIVTFNRIFDQSRNVELIFDTLKDHRIYVRQTAADCINACISLINKRDYSNE